jgi:hypothetical protein
MKAYLVLSANVFLSIHIHEVYAKQTTMTKTKNNIPISAYIEWGEININLFLRCTKIFITGM